MKRILMAAVLVCMLVINHAMAEPKLYTLDEIIANGGMILNSSEGNGTRAISPDPEGGGIYEEHMYYLVEDRLNSTELRIICYSNDPTRHAVYDVVEYKCIYCGAEITTLENLRYMEHDIHIIEDYHKTGTEFHFEKRICSLCTYQQSTTYHCVDPACR